MLEERQKGCRAGGRSLMEQRLRRRISGPAEWSCSVGLERRRRKHRETVSENGTERKGWGDCTDRVFFSATVPVLGVSFIYAFREKYSNCVEVKNKLPW